MNSTSLSLSARPLAVYRGTWGWSGDVQPIVRAAPIDIRIGVIQIRGWHNASMDTGPPAERGGEIELWFK